MNRMVWGLGLALLVPGALRWGARYWGAGPPPHRVAHVVVYQQNAAQVHEPCPPT